MIRTVSKSLAASKRGHSSDSDRAPDWLETGDCFAIGSRRTITSRSFPWPDRFDEETDTDEINQWFFERSRDKPLQQVIRESNATFDRVEHAIATMTEEDLFESGRFDWIFWTDEGLGPAVVRGAWDHYHIDHEPEILAWLARNRAAGADS
ncbi:MAG: ClbS/DfsB family four-helix bundle protein [Thermomicrobiales bacterium]